MAFLKFLAIENITPLFWPMSIYGITSGWIRIPLGTEVRLGPGDTVLDGDPPPPRKGAQQPPTFRPTALARISTGPHFVHNTYW